jgi:hypothetical protein
MPVAKLASDSWSVSQTVSLPAVSRSIRIWLSPPPVEQSRWPEELGETCR